MRVLALLVLLAPPQPVTSIGAVINPDDSVTISWILPADPTVVGITIIRDRLDLFEPNTVFTLNGPVTEFTDATGLVTANYRYWVYTRNAGGELSRGAFVEVFGRNAGFVGGTTSSWFRIVAASDSVSPLPFLLGLLLLLAALTPFGR